MAELVDALDSKSGYRKVVQVRFLFWAPKLKKPQVIELEAFLVYTNFTFHKLNIEVLINEWFVWFDSWCW
jgi:hypothetical protein